MKLLVLGGEGMLGHKVFQRLKARFPGTSCTIRGSLREQFYRKIALFSDGEVLENFDAMDWDTCARRIRDTRPDVVVNCIGIVKQRAAARAPIPSITLNALWPHRLHALQTELGGRVVHISTDCVFAGRSGRYTEESESDACDLYGKTKFLGEVAGPGAITLRTSIIGRELAEFKSLLEWFLAQEGRTIRGYTRVIYSGVTTNHLAQVIADLLEKAPELSGLFQVASKPISKHDLLCGLRDAYGLRVNIEPSDTEVCDRSMVGQKFEAATGYRCPPWAELLKELAADETPYREWRGE